MAKKPAKSKRGNPSLKQLRTAARLLKRSDPPWVCRHGLHFTKCDHCGWSEWRTVKNHEAR